MWREEKDAAALLRGAVGSGSVAMLRELLAVAAATPGIAGFQIDLETKAQITTDDVRQLTTFLRNTTTAFRTGPPTDRNSRRLAAACPLD